MWQKFILFCVDLMAAAAAATDNYEDEGWARTQHTLHQASIVQAPVLCVCVFENNTNDRVGVLITDRNTTNCACIMITMTWSMMMSCIHNHTADQTMIWSFAMWKLLENLITSKEKAFFSFAFDKLDGYFHHHHHYHQSTFVLFSYLSTSNAAGAERICNFACHTDSVVCTCIWSSQLDHRKHFFLFCWCCCCNHSTFEWLQP